MRPLIYSKRRAFTLVEVMIIAGILSTGLFILAQVFVPGFEAKQKTESYSIMSMLAQSMVEEIKREGYQALEQKYPGRSFGQGKGKFKEYPEFLWQVEWWQTETPNLRKLKVKVWGKIEKEGTLSEMEILTYLAKR